MGNLFDALQAAANLNVQSEQSTQTKTITKTEAKPKLKTTTKAQATEKKTQAKTDTPKTKGGASYVIPKEFNQAIEDHLKGRADMKDKLTKKGKSIDGCCDYIFDVMRKRAEKERNGKSAVGMYAPPEEIFGLAAHCYDESDEDLKKEMKG